MYQRNTIVHKTLATYQASKVLQRENFKAQRYLKRYSVEITFAGDGIALPTQKSSQWLKIIEKVVSNIAREASYEFEFEAFLVKSLQ